LGKKSLVDKPKQALSSKNATHKNGFESKLGSRVASLCNPARALHMKPGTVTASNLSALFGASAAVRDGERNPPPTTAVAAEKKSENEDLMKPPAAVVRVRRGPPPAAGALAVAARRRGRGRLRARRRLSGGS
jgi:hypothetical protein